MGERTPGANIMLLGFSEPEVDLSNTKTYTTTKHGCQDRGETSCHDQATERTTTPQGRRCFQAATRTAATHREPQRPNGTRETPRGLPATQRTGQGGTKQNA